MHLPRRTLLGSALATTATAPFGALRTARAQGAQPVLRLGVLTDLSGPYRDTGGPGSVACTRQAAEEAQAALPGALGPVRR